MRTIRRSLTAPGSSSSHCFLSSMGFSRNADRGTLLATESAIMRRHRPARLLCVLTLTALLGGCGAEEPPRLSDAGPPPAKPSTQWKQGDRGALLVASGRQAFEGRGTSRCVVHDNDGLQINLRTGDPDLPTVAVRIEEFQGEGDRES